MLKLLTHFKRNINISKKNLDSSYASAKTFFAGGCISFFYLHSPDVGINISEEGIPTFSNVQKWWIFWNIRDQLPVWLWIYWWIAWIYWICGDLLDISDKTREMPMDRLRIGWEMLCPCLASRQIAALVRRRIASVNKHIGSLHFGVPWMGDVGKKMKSRSSHDEIWVWVKIRYPNNWMVNTN